MAAAPNPAAFDQAITITATVTNTAVAAITPTGTATFQDVFNGVTTNLGTYNLVNGVATFTTSALAVGSHTITATYSGDTDFSGSTTTTAVAQTIDADSTSTTITASSSNPNPAIYGQSLSFTATSPTPRHRPDTGRHGQLLQLARPSWPPSTWMLRVRPPTPLRPCQLALTP